MASRKRSPAIKKGAKVLLIGAGRIGCEVLKTLAFSGCQDIHIIDMGLIKVADLNGQFLFRASDVGKSKASVARCAVLKFRPHISITPYHACVEHPHFAAGFFSQFDVVLNTLDNFEATRRVNRLCLAVDVPLIESWTAGFLGQVTVHVKRQTECYECHPKPALEMHHVCNTTSTSSEVLRHGLFESNEIVGYLGPAVETTNAIIAGLIVIETVKVLQNDTKKYRMTYSSIHPTKKMLLMPMKPFEPNKSCYVCSKTPLSLEINTKCAKLRDIVEKVVKNKLGMNPSHIRHGAAFLYEVGTGLNAAMKINYESNLDKVLSEFPSPVTSGTMLNIVDSHQGLSCKINIKHREEFDEENEPDGMVLLGLISTNYVSMDDKESNADSGSSSSDSEPEADKDNEIECAPEKKRKRSEVLGEDMSNVAGDTTSHGKLEVFDEISNGKRSRSEDPEKELHHLGAFPDDCAAAPCLSNKGFKSIKPKPSLVVGGEGCRICGDDHHHTVHCSFLDYLPPGTTVGPDYWVICGVCGSKLPQPSPEWCGDCCERGGGRAVEPSKYDFFDEDWRHHHPELFWGLDESQDVRI